MPVHDFPEDCDHSIVVKLIDCNHVEMTDKSWRHWVTATTCNIFMLALHAPYFQRHYFNLYL